jgi:hypothetical protein
METPLSSNNCCSGLTDLDLKRRWRRGKEVQGVGGGEGRRGGRGKYFFKKLNFDMGRKRSSGPGAGAGVGPSSRNPTSVEGNRLISFCEIKFLELIC